MTSPFSFTSKTDGVDDHLAAHVNALQLAADVMAKSPSGTLFNGKIQISVASNNITVALKTLDGNDPSASDPVYVSVNGTVRLLDNALSVTKNAGTNWFNSGSTQLATQEVDYFVYLIWDTVLTPDDFDIGFARIPYARIASEFSGTTTNEKYIAKGNGSALSSANDVVVIGRFNATLSATASFNWSLPATSVIIQRPIYQSRLLDWNPAPTGFSVLPSSTEYRYRIEYDDVTFDYLEGADGTSNATTFTATLPFAGVAPNTMLLSNTVDNGVTLTTPGRITLPAGSSTITFRSNTASGGWTNANGKRASVSGRYRI